MISDYDISLGRAEDIPGILVLQEANLAERGGGLAVRQTADWYRNAIREKSLVVGRYDSKGRWLRLGDFACGESACDDCSNHAAQFPASARLLSLWAGLCCKDTAWKRSCRGAFPSIANTHGWPTRDDIHTSRQHAFVTGAPENGHERTWCLRNR